MTSITVRNYTSADWVALWQLRFTQLAEHGIFLTDDDIPTVPGLPDNDTYEWDLNHIDEVYLGGGGFWLAWQGEEPVGSVGSQDLGGEPDTSPARAWGCVNDEYTRGLCRGIFPFFGCPRHKGCVPFSADWWGVENEFVCISSKI